MKTQEHENMKTNGCADCTCSQGISKSHLGHSLREFQDDKGKDLIQVCESKTCDHRFSRKIMEELQKYYQEDSGVQVEYRGCTGYCEEANNVSVNGNILSHVTPERAVKRVEEARKFPQGDGTKGEFKKLALGDDLFLGA